MMSPTEFAKLLQENNRENNVILMEKLKKGLKEELTIFKHYIENMVGEAMLEVNEKVMELEERIQDKEHEIVNLKKDLEDSNAETLVLRKEILNLTSKTTSLDFHSRKRNVVIYKVAETERSNYELFKMTHNLVKNTADTRFKESDIDQVCRIGKKGPSPRPILLTLTRVHSRNQLLNRSKSFINKRMRIEEDLPRHILLARKHMYKLAEHLKKEGKRAVFRRDKFIVDEVEWSAERIQQSIQLLPRRTESRI